ncbi:MAG: glycosyltransferase [Phycisphaeraceae bacterium]|nr:glycosyltransferase [Phycisphaeraceae bacterium]
MPHPPRIALAHDWLCGFRGGEAVLDRIAQLIAREFPHSPPPRLYIMTDDRRPLSPAIDALPKARSFLSRIPGGNTRLRRWLLPLYPRAVDGLSRQLAADHAREPIDLLISTSSAAIKGLCPPTGVPHLCYCHSPARYIWSQSAQYSGGLRGIGLRLARNGFQSWDRATAANVTQFVANSTHTAREIARCYQREAVVIHPPVRTDFFTPDPSVPREDFWLCIGALEPYKRFDLAIDAAAIAGARLVIAGGGSHEGTLRARAAHAASTSSRRARIEFAGRVNNEQLRDLYRRASVLLFPQIEDFGIVAVEAQACGLPVAATAGGGALDSVVDGQTGALVRDATPQGLADAASDVARHARADGSWHDRCRANAERFAERVFDGAMLAQIRRLLPGSAG